MKKSLDHKDTLEHFSDEQIETVTSSSALAEELVVNQYKMSSSQWLKLRYDVKTLANLSVDEIVHGPFAQVIRYEGKRKGATLGSSLYDFYKICLQDHAILDIMKNQPGIKLFPFSLYIITHELIHIVRFSKFLQNFNASDNEKHMEEQRVHKKTREILEGISAAGMEDVLRFYNAWLTPSRPSLEYPGNGKKNLSKTPKI